MSLKTISCIYTWVGMLTLLAGCAGDTAAPAEVRPVRAQQVKLGVQAAQSTYSGEVRARYEWPLGFRVGGKIISRAVDVGATVQPGQVLAQLDAQDLRLDTAAAQSQLAAAQADLTQAGAELARYKELLDRKFISPAEYDRRLNTYNVAEARAAQVAAQLQVSANQTQYAVLRADRAGVVIAVDAEAGQVVAAGQPVLRLAQPQHKEILIAVPENRLGEVAAAGDIRVVLWARSEKTYRGRVREVSPSADAVTRTYAVRIAVPDADGAMQLGMTATVALSRAGVAPAAELPLTALYDRDRRPAVWIVDARTMAVALKPVEVGEYRERTFTVTAGLADGDTVVTAGVHKLVAGQKVRLLDAAVRP
jgi:RND family efflux transporter MFP subunit